MGPPWALRKLSTSLSIRTSCDKDPGSECRNRAVYDTEWAEGARDGGEAVFGDPYIPSPRLTRMSFGLYSV